MTQENNDNERRVLIVEDSPFFAKLVQGRILSDLKIESDIAGTYKAAVEQIECYPGQYYLAVLDLNLPDSTKGEVVDYTLKQGIPAIVVTADLNKNIRDTIIRKRILDYLVKSGENILDQLIEIIMRLSKNQQRKILVVDDSKSARFVIRTLLEVHKFQILEAENGKDALGILKSDKDIRMVLTDNQMPVMDGYELIQAIRQSYSKEDMAVIGISSHGSGIMCANYLKRGANDFISKPFVIEEFYQRVNLNWELLDHIDKLRDTSIKDYLTGTYNRRYFFESGAEKFNLALAGQKILTLSMIDIDHFKTVNDNHGHESGDRVIVEIARKLKEKFAEDRYITARIGGEEFCLLSIGVEPETIRELLEQFRLGIEKHAFQVKDQSFSCTVSIGSVSVQTGSFHAAINRADQCLYRAKNEGRNRLVCENFSI